MKYYEVKFRLSPCSDDAADVLAALAAEAGFETFEPAAEGVTGYVQQTLFDRPLLDLLLQSFPFEGVSVSYTVNEAEDRDWNEQWEQEGFEPIVVADRLVIHDGRHMAHQDLSNPIEVEIDAHLAFGTGTHETTRMVCTALLETAPARRVLDCGCGTGILGIVAMKLGAGECVAYDIDEWSVDNTRHNAVINQVDVTAMHGDSSILNKVEGTFSLVMANINRNILLADMPVFVSKMETGARLIVSGFYEADSPLLEAKAAKLGLRLQKRYEDHGWACLVFDNH